jgi:hypothetical protein
MLAYLRWDGGAKRSQIRLHAAYFFRSLSTVSLNIAVAWSAPIRQTRRQENSLQQTRQKMVSRTVLSRLTLTDLPSPHKRACAPARGFFEASLRAPAFADQ